MHQERLLAVGIVSTTSGLEAEVAGCVRSVRTAVPDVPIFLGGSAIGSSAEALDLGGDMWTGLGTHAAVETVEQIADSLRGRAQARVA